MYPIRIFGDPVLRQRASEIEEIDDALRRLAEDMLETMYDAPGVGLAAPQIGVQRRLFARWQSGWVDGDREHLSAAGGQSQ